MRVGADYQASIPNSNSVKKKPASKNHPENSILVWSPQNNIPDEKCIFLFMLVL